MFVDTKEEELPQGQRYLQYVAASPGGITGAYRYWGLPRSNDAIRVAGFDRIFQTPNTITLDAAEELEVEATEAVVMQSIQQKGWDVHDVEALVMATGSPPIHESQVNVLNYARFIADYTGMERSIPVFNVWAGCSSGAIGIIHALDKFHDKRVVIAATEGMTRLAPYGEDPDRADQFSRAVFTNAGSAIALDPYDITLLSSSISQIVDPRALSAVMTYKPHINNLIPESGASNGIIHTNEEYFAVDLAPPPESLSISMHPGETARFFIRHGEEMLRQYAGRSYNHLIIHHPSRRVHDALIERASNLGISFEHPPTFDIKNGNSSASTTNIHFISKLTDMQPGNTALLFGFGAGATFASAELQIN